MQTRSVFLCLLSAPVLLGAPPELPLVKAERGVIHRWVALPGVLNPYRQVQLGARVSGYLKRVEVDRGERVKAGQVLALVEVPELEADLIKMQVELEAARIELKRLQEARAKSPDLVLPQTVDNAEARVLGAKASVDRSRALLEFAQIRAPFDGQIASRHVDEGAFVSPGGGTLFRLIENQRLRCQIPVTEMETPLAVAGKPVRIVADALPGRVFETKLARVSGFLEQATRTMLVEADVEPAGTGLIAGMSATARIGVEQHEDVPRVPVGAVLFEKSGASVFRYAEGKVAKTSVKAGFNDGAFVELPEWKGEESVVVFGALLLTDGQAVIPKAPVSLK